MRDENLFKHALVVVVGVSLPLWGQAADLTWDGSTGNWDVPTNWSSDVVPQASDYAIINNSGTAQLPSGVTGNYDTLLVGTNATGAVVVEGGLLAGWDGMVAQFGGAGSVTVNSGTWINADNLLVGYWGTGSLTINGGLVSNGNTSVIGATALGTGTVTVNGGTWNNSTTLQVGSAGQGSLVINGGLVAANGFVMLGLDTGGVGAITISSSGTLSTQFLQEINTGSISLDGGVLQARANQAALLVGFETGDVAITSNGGTIDTQGYTVGIASGLTGPGGLNKTGSGVLLLTGSNSYAGGTYIASGTVTVSSGGSINHASGDMYLDGGGLNIGGGSVSGRIGYVGAFFGPGSATVSSGTWTNASQLYVGYGVAGSLSVTNGLVTATSSLIGGDGAGTVTVNSGTFANSGSLYVGSSGTGTLQVNGGRVSAATARIGDSSTAHGSVVVNGGTMSYSDSLTVGYRGIGLLTIDGGVVTSTGSGQNVTIGDEATGHGEVLVTGQGSMLVAGGQLLVGRAGSGNAITITDDALVQVNSIAFSTFGGTDNHVRIHEGYLALFGNQTALVGDLISDGYVQLWDGSQWVGAFTSGVQITYYAPGAGGDAAAQSATGYSGLGGYTVVTAQTVPEPSTWALMALGTVVAGYRLLRRRIS